MQKQFPKYITFLFILFCCASQCHAQWVSHGKKSSYLKDGVKHVYYSKKWHEDVPEQGFTSEMHLNNIGKIVFSNDIIPFQKEDATKIKSTFTSGESIYGRMYLICSLPNDTIYWSSEAELQQERTGLNKLIKKKQVQVARGTTNPKSARAEFRVFIDGTLTDWVIEQVRFTSETLKHTTRQVWISPKPEDEKVSRYWLEEIDKLPEGEHTVRIEYVPAGRNIIRPLAAGEFTLVKDNNATVSTGVRFADLEEGRKDANLASEALEIMRKKYDEKGWDGEVTKVRFRTDWLTSTQIGNSQVSRIREIRMYVYTEHGNGKCMVEEHTMAQSMNGIRPTGPYFYRRVIPSSKQRVDCD
ncbi:MAG: hypothetical protein AAFU57_09695 [Bacteroidota bacterium]